MKPGALLTALAEKGLQIRKLSDGAIVVCGPTRSRDETLIDACRRNRSILDWALEGAKSGHVFLACDQCAEVQLVAMESKGKRCIMTPQCGGRLSDTPLPWLVP